ncbi:MAG: DUF2232 domain-containing protein [Moorellales bacterium]
MLGATLVAALFLPGVAGMPVALAVPLSLAVGLGGWPLAVGIGTVGAAVLAYSDGVLSALAGLVGPILAGLGCGLGLRRQKRAGLTVLATTVGLAAGLLLQWPRLGSAWVHWQQDWRAGVEVTLEFYRQSGLLAAMAAQGVGAEQFRQNLEVLALLVGRLYPTVLVWEIAAAATAVYFFSRWAIKRWRPVAAVPPFSHWQLPWPWVWGLIGGLAIYLLGDWRGIQGAVTLGLNLVVAYLPMLALYGLAVLIYLYRHIALPAWVKAVGFFPLVLYLPLGLAVLVCVGLFDPWLNFRRLAPQEGGGNR